MSPPATVPRWPPQKASGKDIRPCGGLQVAEGQNKRNPIDRKGRFETT